MKIINEGLSGDYHLHTSTFSDGFNSLDEVVVQAGKLKLKEIAITDHSQAYLDACGMRMKTHYKILVSRRWRNIHNDVNVIFGVEADLLNQQGDLCDHIQGLCPPFVILSSHARAYRGDPKKIKNGYLNAIARHGPKIDFLGHLCSKQFSSFLNSDDIVEIVRAANEADIAVEFNCAHWVNGETCEASLKVMLSCCDALYVNSDAHTLYELSCLREEGFRYLKKLFGSGLGVQGSAVDENVNS